MRSNRQIVFKDDIRIADCESVTVSHINSMTHKDAVTLSIQRSCAVWSINFHVSLLSVVV